MDPIELGRQHARLLHSEAVQRGRNPWCPYEFAVGIANDLGITVETCAPGAAMLDGGRASFDPDLRLIVHEINGTPFVQAFLVAHEVGHAELGDGEEEAEPAVHVDPARTSEAAPAAGAVAPGQCRGSFAVRVSAHGGFPSLLWSRLQARRLRRNL